MTTNANQTYQEAARHLLTQAEAELAAGDSRQAAEKGWGAAVQAVKALCERRGWRHRNYRRLQRAIKQLETENENMNIELFFRSAYLLHVNFYEDSEDAVWVSDGLAHVRSLMDTLEALP